ncbi:hypothetical protein GF359_06555 [candidate division WOR-3 bacterium]|uniref:Uncharacterized protein n=1 Tax=candidate division WOR-3 bacterium TaxID=2052148 RepID=A0A9D5QCS0_UNCW3|nr:hypothetical protein [candidate division WOR-3 bacterium]MBD3364859.1 hypothetical protein [candidate division WOR-3 bacterium]
MTPLIPSSDDIIFALEALSFDVTDENDEYAVMSDGIYSIKVYFNPDDEQVKKMRSMLTEIFSDYENRVQALIENGIDDVDEYAAGYDDDDYDEAVYDTDNDLDYADEVRRIKMWLNRRV